MKAKYALSKFALLSVLILLFVLGMFFAVPKKVAGADGTIPDHFTAYFNVEYADNGGVPIYYEKTLFDAPQNTVLDFIGKEMTPTSVTLYNNLGQELNLEYNVTFNRKNSQSEYVPIEGSPIFAGEYQIVVGSPDGAFDPVNQNFSISSDEYDGKTFFFVDFDYSGAEFKTNYYEYKYIGFEFVPSVVLRRADESVATISNLNKTFVKKEGGTTVDVWSNLELNEKYCVKAYSQSYVNEEYYIGSSKDFAVSQTVIDLSDEGTYKIGFGDGEELTQTNTEFYTDVISNGYPFNGYEFSEIYFKIKLSDGSFALLNKNIYKIISKEMDGVALEENPQKCASYTLAVSLLNGNNSISSDKFKFYDGQQNVDYVEISFDVTPSDCRMVEFVFAGATYDEDSNTYSYDYTGDDIYPVIKIVNGQEQYDGGADMSALSIVYKDGFGNPLSTDYPIYAMENGGNPVYYYVEVSSLDLNKCKLMKTFVSPRFKINKSLQNLVLGVAVSAKGIYGSGSNIYYTGKPLDESSFDLKFKQSNGDNYNLQDGYRITEYYKISGNEEILLSDAPSSVGTYRLKVEYTSGIRKGMTKLSEKFTVTLKPGYEALSQKYLNIVYNKDNVIGKELDLNILFKNYNNAAIMLTEYTVKYYDSEFNELPSSPKAVDGNGQTFYFTVTVPAITYYSFFKEDEGVFSEKAVSEKFAFTLNRTELTLAAYSVKDKIYDGTDLAELVATKQNGAYVLNGKDSSYTDVYIKSVVSKFEDKNVAYDSEGNVVQKTVAIEFELDGADKDLYYISSIVCYAKIEPKTVVIQGFNVVNYYHASQEEIDEFNKTEFDITEYVIQGDDVAVDGMPQYEYGFDAGDYDIYFDTLSLTGAQKDNYVLSCPARGEYKWTVLPSEIVIVPETAGKIYGQNDAVDASTQGLDIAFSYDTSLEFDGNIVKEVKFVRTPGEDAGEYVLSIEKVKLVKQGVEVQPLSQSEPLKYLNYTIKIADNSVYTISKKNLEIVAKAGSSVYDGRSVNDKLEYEPITDLVFNNAANIRLSVSSFEKGRYTVALDDWRITTYDGSRDVTSNYEINFVPAEYEIKAKSVVYVLSEDSVLTKVYGDKDGYLGCQLKDGYSLVQGHTAVTAITRQSGEDAAYDKNGSDGGYFILPPRYGTFSAVIYDANGVDVTKNYNVDFDNSEGKKFTITQRLLTVTMDDMEFVLYKDTGREDYEKIKKMVIFHFEGFAYNESQADFTSKEYPTVRFPSYEEISEGTENGSFAITITSGESFNYRFNCIGSTLTVIKAENVLEVNQSTQTEVNTLGRFYSDNKINQTISIYNVQTYNGVLPGTAMELRFAIPTEYLGDNTVALYYADAEGNVTLVENATIVDGEFVVNTKNVIGTYIIGKNTGYMLLIVLAGIFAVILLAGLVLMVIILVKRARSDKKSKSDGEHAEDANVNPVEETSEEMEKVEEVETTESKDVDFVEEQGVKDEVEESDESHVNLKKEEIVQDNVSDEFSFDASSFEETENPVVNLKKEEKVEQNASDEFSFDATSFEEKDENPVEDNTKQDTGDVKLADVEPTKGDMIDFSSFNDEDEKN